MPIDPSIPLGVRSQPFNNPFQALIAMREGEQQRVSQQREDELRATQQRQAQQRIDQDQQRIDSAEKKEFTAKQIHDAAENAYQKIKDGNAEEVLRLLPPESRVLAESWLGEIDKAKQERDARGIALGKQTAKFIQANNYDPVTSETSLKLLSDVHPGAKDALEHVTDPAAFKKLIDHFATLGDKPEADFTLGEGQTRFDPTGKPIAAVAKPPDEPKSLDAAITAARNNPTELNRLLKLKRQEAEAGHVKSDPTVRYQSKEVLNDAGKPVTVNFDAVSGQYLDPATKQPIKSPRPVPSAQEMMDSRKFQKSAPVLSAIGELSEKINTGSGLLAKARGGAEKIAAKANYDDDVAEYQALVSGFTPLVARSLGHTGVLTQQDVDSVKELFPKPGDSKTLRDRKVKRLMGIVGELEGTEGVGGVAPKAGDVEEYDLVNGKLVRKK